MSSWAEAIAAATAGGGSRFQSAGSIEARGAFVGSVDLVEEDEFAVANEADDSLDSPQPGRAIVVTDKTKVLWHRFKNRTYLSPVSSGFNESRNFVRAKASPFVRP